MKDEYKPVPKIMNGGIGGAVAIIIIGILEQAGLKIDSVLAGAITLVVYFAVGYITPPGGMREQAEHTGPATVPTIHREEENK